MRRDNEPPAATARWGWRYHHTGIPTTEPRPGERHLPHLGVYVSGFGESPYGVEWMRFEPGSRIPEIVRRLPHVAFEVDDIEAALEGRNVVCPPDSPSAGVRAALFIDDGSLIEVIQFERTASGLRPAASGG